MAESQDPTGPQEASEQSAALFEELYEELRKLARARMARIPAGQTLQPTALVHEVWIRLSRATETRWSGRGHFFGAAALAMRRILVEQARRKQRLRHGGDQQRLDVDDVDIAIEVPVEDILALDQVLTRLEQENPRQAQIVLLRWFAGLEREEVAELMDLSVRTVDREWRTVAARLRSQLDSDAPKS
jgi:RNA polymerase sigma factor (TIGR02999 family)